MPTSTQTSNPSSVSPAKAAQASSIHVKSVQLALLAPDPDQVRKHFDQAALQSLADSIKANGLIQPIVVRPRAPGEPSYAGVREHDYRIVAGERRFRAARLAGITEIPVIVRDDLAAGDITVLQVLENLQRQDLSLAETCTGVQRLVDTIGFAKTCQQLGKSEPWVSKHAGLHKLPEAVVELVRLGKIESVDIARELAAVKELDEEHFERLVERFKPQQAKAPEPDELPDPATEAEAELLVDQVSETQMWSNRPPTRADIRAALASLRLEREEEKAAAAVRDRSGNVNGTSHDEDAGDQEEEDAQEEAQPQPRPLPPPTVAADHERRARREYVEKLQAENAAFAEQRRWQLERLLGGAPLKDAGDSTDGVSLDEKYLHDWGNEPLPADPMGSTFVVRATGPVERVAPALRALGITTEISIDPEDLTLDEAEAIAKLLGRPLRIVRIEHLSGGQLFEALNAEAARQAAAKKPTGKGKAKATKIDAADDPHGIAAFLAACVKKSRIPGRRIQPRCCTWPTRSGARRRSARPSPSSTTAGGRASKTPASRRCAATGSGTWASSW